MTAHTKESLRSEFHRIVRLHPDDNDLAVVTKFPNASILTPEIITDYADYFDEPEDWNSLMVQWGICNKIPAADMHKRGITWNYLQAHYPMTMDEIASIPHRRVNALLAANRHLTPDYFPMVCGEYYNADSGEYAGPKVAPNLIDDAQFANARRLPRIIVTEDLPFRRYLKYCADGPLPEVIGSKWLYEEMIASGIAWKPYHYAHAVGYTVEQYETHMSLDADFKRFYLNANDTVENIAREKFDFRIIFNPYLSADDIAQYIADNDVDFEGLMQDAIQSYCFNEDSIDMKLTREQVEAYADVDEGGILRMFCDEYDAKTRIDACGEDSLRLLADCYAALDRDE